MATRSIEDKSTGPVAAEGDENRKIAEALKLVAELEAAGVKGSRFNLESPYRRRASCSTCED